MEPGDRPHLVNSAWLGDLRTLHILFLYMLSSVPCTGTIISPSESSLAIDHLRGFSIVSMRHLWLWLMSLTEGLSDGQQSSVAQEIDV
jgi:hypothetical protein